MVGSTMRDAPLRNARGRLFGRRIKRDRLLLLMVALPVIYFFVFHYLPMYGVLIAFKNYSPTRGIFGSPWVGLKYFRQFFNSAFFWRLLRNTFVLSFYNLLFGFPLPIVFALLLNEVRHPKYKKVVQTVSYLPYFVSLVVVVGLMVNLFAADSGLVNNARAAMGLDRIPFMSDASKFRSLYVGSEVWQKFGWNSIIYIAAITGISPELYEAASIDGANRMQRVWHVTLPGIQTTMIILLILSLGNLMSVGYEKIILMYSPATYETSDVISTYVYRRGLNDAEYSFGAAVGLFNSAVNLTLLLMVNGISRKVSDVALF